MGEPLKLKNYSTLLCETDVESNLHHKIVETKSEMRTSIHIMSKKKKKALIFKCSLYKLLWERLKHVTVPKMPRQTDHADIKSIHFSPCEG